MRPRRGIGAALVLVLATTACTGSDTGSEPPRSGATPSSCPSYSSSPALVRDTVLDVKVQHVEESVVIELHQQDVVDSRAQIWSFDVRTPATSWMVDVFTTRRGTEAWLFENPPLPPASDSPAADGCDRMILSSEGDPCRGVMARVAPLEDVVDLVIPRRCLDNPEWVQVGVTVSDRDHESTYSDPKLGPRVGVI
jgi:hypothetical protein